MNEMKVKQSLLAVFAISILFIIVRLTYYSNNDKNGYNATSWDAFGYYMYLPSTFIYQDYKELDWVEEIDKAYNVTGGTFYQSTYLERGNYTNKYLSGVAILQSPFFALGHVTAKLTGAPQDGFSWPYQYAILWGAIFYSILGLLILRKVLLEFFEEPIVAWTLLFLGFTSNWLQYVSVDGAMSHAYLFPLYALLIYQTIRWHRKPNRWSALFIGAIIGLAVISRPTELIMIFIPLLWNTHTKEERNAKWNLVRKHLPMVGLAFLGGLIAISPQLLYWKHTTGSFIYNVGSKWTFLNPWWRVLVGPEKGWLLYTPIALLMIIGLFLNKEKAYRKPLLVFGLLNIWIIISWWDWKYGASYSTRALVQSYPVYVFGIAAVLKWLKMKQVSRFMFPVAFILLTTLNIYQLYIYNSKGIIENFSPFLF